MFSTLLAMLLGFQQPVQPAQQPVLIIFSIPSPVGPNDPVCPPCEAFKRDEKREPLRSLLRRYRVIRYTDKSPECQDYGATRFPTFWVENDGWLMPQVGYFGPEAFQRYLETKKQ